MNILFVANHYIEKGKPTKGFPAYLYRVTQALLSFGHTPIIVAGSSKNEYSVKDNVEIYEVLTEDNKIGFHKYGYVISYMRTSYAINKKVREICKQRHIDIIQFTSLCLLAFFYYGKTPSVLRLSSYAGIAGDVERRKNSDLVKVQSILEILAANRCNAVFAPSKVTADAFARDLDRNVSVIETPFTFDNENLDFSIFKRLLADKKYVLFFGALYLEKGILNIADIIYEFLEYNDDYHYVFCGEDVGVNGKSARSILRNSAKDMKDRVIFIHSLPHEQLFPIIMGAEFVTLPSYMENFSNACIEAMYLKKIVIGTEGASFEQLITDGENGLLCKRNNSESLLGKMNQAVNLDGMRKRNMEISANKRILRLKPEITVKKLVAFYEYVISSIK